MFCIQLNLMDGTFNLSTFRHVLCEISSNFWQMKYNKSCGNWLEVTSKEFKIESFHENYLYLIRNLRFHLEAL